MPLLAPAATRYLWLSWLNVLLPIPGVGGASVNHNAEFSIKLESFPVPPNRRAWNIWKYTFSHKKVFDWCLKHKKFLTLGQMAMCKWTQANRNTTQQNANRFHDSWNVLYVHTHILRCYQSRHSPRITRIVSCLYLKYQSSRLCFKQRALTNLLAIILFLILVYVYQTGLAPYLTPMGSALKHIRGWFKLWSNRGQGLIGCYYYQATV